MNTRDDLNHRRVGTERNAIATDRRKLLLGGTALVTASVLSAAAIRDVQAQQAAPAGGKPNIVVIWPADYSQPFS